MASYGWSQAKVAEEFGVSRPAVSQWLAKLPPGERPELTVTGLDGKNDPTALVRPPVEPDPADGMPSTTAPAPRRERRDPGVFAIISNQRRQLTAEDFGQWVRNHADVRRPGGAGRRRGRPASNRRRCAGPCRDDRPPRLNRAL